MKTTLIKQLALGIIGGIIPLSAYLTFNYVTDDTKLSDKVLDGNRIATARFASMQGTPVDFIQASENSINSVVHVTTKVVQTSFQRDIFQEFFYGPGAGGKEYKQYGSGSGSGVIVSSEGYIVTNNHVIENASEIEVILNDNSKYTAKIVGTDPSTDIAILKVEGTGFQPIPLGNSDDLKIGEWVLAVGNPFNLTSTVTAGIVSAKARNINLLSDRSKQDVIPIESFIQTDAAVNPGNSGGALVNTKGELVGINTAIASQTGSYSGYSFAVPVNLVEKVMRDVIDYGVVQRGYLGVQINDITQEIKTKNNLPSTKGVFVTKVVEDGSADKAGIKDGEVILKIGTKEVNSVASLQEEIGKRRPGDKVSVTIRNKKGEEEIVELVLRNKEGETKLISKEEVSKQVALGASFVELTDKEKKELNISSGVKIKSIQAGKLKAIGLTEGMIISKINNEPVETVEQLTTKLNGVNRGVLLEVITESGQREYKGLGL
ncbi:MAG: trypsin-like peptidase domain-containing protein [Crocinitomicaceae bacterium]|nr:trypsin-like peptidase domain-containing protein [Crocinitomicaceae bacterium]